MKVEKSRKQRRKEARLAKGKRKLDSWVNHQQSRNSIENADEKEVRVSSAGCSRERKKKVKSKTKFGELYEMEKGRRDILAEEDFITVKKYEKKYKVKNGNLGGDDGLSLVLGEEISWSSEECDRAKELVGTKREKKRSNFAASDYIELERKPAKKLKQVTLKANDDDMNHAELERSTLEQVQNGGAKERDSKMAHLRLLESEEHAKIRSRLRGLLNRLCETNVESITEEISTIFHAVGRSAGSEIISQQVLASCAGGPRGNEQYAATFAAFVAGTACLVGIEFGAKVLASLATCFEKDYLKEDNLSLRNLVLLLSYLYIFGVCTRELVYDFMTMLSKRLTEVDVSTILTILQTCGMKLRGDDPIGMKNFIQSVQLRVNELKASSGDGQANMSAKRMEFMLETICEIKNNKKRPKEETVQHTRIKKWLQKLRVDDILVKVTKWSKLLDPDKKGHWWLSGDLFSTEKVDEVASEIDWEVNEAQKLLDLAAAHRMNTDARRAIFCVIMSGEDYRDAFAKLISLDLHGKQDREITRVLMECCVQEKVFNKYYTILGSKLCKHNKNHKFTLQYCLWDQYKEVETMPLLRSMHLAKFTAEMIASFSLSLAALKVVDLTELTPKGIMHFRMLFEDILALPDKIVWNVFSRVAITPEYESLRIGIKFFITKYVISCQKSLEKKFKIVNKALKYAL